jgi:hypothetical protein
MIVLLQDIPSLDLTDQGDEDVWETVWATAERDTSPPPTAKGVVAEEAQQQTGTLEP